eukprot:TRINITY_DN11159_c0_g1_i1.p3 TRINITY_DN11159_c0_g1~~TRINITY_DN11159_c0_g1_i1.p3  ORF type:complete len:108 (+),score=14.33 TRINITY_DN11159_c0_g1_i1:900-1223(+)
MNRIICIRRYISKKVQFIQQLYLNTISWVRLFMRNIMPIPMTIYITCLLYTSDAADDMQCVDLGGRRIIKKKKKINIGKQARGQQKLGMGSPGSAARYGQKRETVDV